MRFWIQTLLTFVLIALALAPFAGCRAVEVTTADGTCVRYVNVGFDTKIGEFTATKTATGTELEFKNLDSQAVMAKALAELAAKAVKP
jgi:hypothetical protein